MFRFLENIDEHRQIFDDLQEMFSKGIKKLIGTIKGNVL